MGTLARTFVPGSAGRDSPFLEVGSFSPANPKLLMIEKGVMMSLSGYFLLIGDVIFRGPLGVSWGSTGTGMYGWRSIWLTATLVASWIRSFMSMRAQGMIITIIPIVIMGPRVGSSQGRKEDNRSHPCCPWHSCCRLAMRSLSCCAMFLTTPDLLVKKQECSPRNTHVPFFCW